MSEPLAQISKDFSSLVRETSELPTMGPERIRAGFRNIYLERLNANQS